MNKQGYPRGNPAEDCQKLQLWWAEEMQKAGFSGAVAVEHLRLDPQQPPALGFGKQLFESLVMQRQATMNTFAYHAAIPGAPWPLETFVMTTESGAITSVIYRAVLKLPGTAEVAFKKSIGMLSDKLEVEGPAAEQFKNRKALLKKIKDGLNRRYEPPAWGFVASKKYFELGEASVTLRQAAGENEVMIVTTVRSESAFVGHNYSLGLDKALGIIKALEHGD
ncbi:MAG TPA: hypothetical protein VK699_13995 [Terriglobales bacterium]|jgi:hypothetical protein|nr:hypothetical protein [Terriglobales bacterium]